MELLDKLGIDKVYLLATSAGGSIAIRFALDYPERTRGLILYCSAMPLVEFETVKGNLSMKIMAPDETALYQGGGTVKEFTVEAPMDGAYPIVVAGRERNRA